MDMISELICCLMETEDYHQDAICQSLEEKKYTKHRKAINFFLPSSKGREREKKNEVKLVINRS